MWKSQKNNIMTDSKKKKGFSSQLPGIVLFVIIFGGWYLIALYDDNDTAKRSVASARTEARSNNFREVGYFKAANKDRIFSVQMIGSVTAAEAKAYAKRKMNTPGRMTAVYFYPSGSIIPADGLTLANNLYAANTVMYDMPGLSKWRYAYMKYRNGKEEFVDCREPNNSGLCR